MLSQNPAILCHKVTRELLLPGLTLDKTCIVLIRHKTDFLAVRFIGHLQPNLRGNLPHLRLRVISDRHQRMCKLLLRQIVKCITLILSGGHGRCDGIPSIRTLHNPCIMTGRNIIRSDFHAAVKQGFPLHIAVTSNTRIRRSAPAVLLHKIINHLLLKLVPKVHDIIRNIQHMRHTPCILHGTPAAAAAFLLNTAAILLLPDLHGRTDHMISLFL